jgi:queuine tRNA-ribosyltransferase
MDSISIKGITYKLPIFLTDATFGVVKSLDSKDIENSGTRGAVVNTYHLLNSPSSKVIQSYGGIKKFMGFEGLVVTDSGGWQIFSLIHRNNKSGKISEEGVVFSYGKLKGTVFTPEDCIQTQFEIGSDIIICLDDFTPPKASEEKVEETIQRTARWASRCKKKYEELCLKYGMTDQTKPLLFAVVQGGERIENRKKSIDLLIEIGFDGYGFGGYMIDDQGNLDLDVSKKLADLIPKNAYKFALGVGSPNQIIKCLEYGWEIFDCTLPTRDARHQRLYIYNQEVISYEQLSTGEFYSFLYLGKDRFLESNEKISEFCKCYTCQNYTKGYLNYLFKIKSTTAYRLASIHNLYFYSDLIRKFSLLKK